MVRKIFYFLFALVVLGSPAFAGEQKCDKCELLKHGVHRQVIPAKKLVCFWWVQPEPRNVLLQLSLKDGTVRKYTKAADAPHGGTHGYICVGRHWVEQMTTTSFICNDVKRFDYGEPVFIGALLLKAPLSRSVEACLYGRDQCAKMGYPAYGHNMPGHPKPFEKGDAGS